MAKLLSDQYESVFSTPSTDITPENGLHRTEAENVGVQEVADVYITQDQVIKVLVSCVPALHRDLAGFLHCVTSGRATSW